MSNRKRNKGGREYKFTKPELGFAHREHRSKKGRADRNPLNREYKRKEGILLLKDIKRGRRN